jgi:2-polyprenyl-3-methyl-5-hydroxy-6-metoxy-1,4-benzoquinol methylase
MIAIVAPFPRPEQVREGWMSRIAAVDRLFAGEQRTYIDVVDDRDYRAAAPERVSATAEVYRLNLSLAAHYDRLRRIVLGAELVYVHTFHLARWVLPFYRTGKIVTDVHGATAEEELMYGKPASCRFYDEVETVVLAESRYAVVVTEAMADHLRRKHPATRCEFVVLPILESRNDPTDRPPRTPGARPRVVYSGGAQRWQNVDLMLDVARERIDACDFTFLTNDVDTFARAARERGIEGRVRIQFAAKDALAGFYREADYGFVLRDDMVVNRVACPTKLSEYLAFGVIPVVKWAELGDFPRLGYRYVTLDDFRRGALPDAGEQRAMRARNAEAIDRLEATFARSARVVQELPHRLPATHWNPLAFLSDRERNVLYPTWSFLQVESAAGPRMLTEHFAEPYDAVTFDLGGASGVHRLTWMPIDRECRIVLRKVGITDAGGDSLAYRRSGNYVESAGNVLTFRARPPLVHFDLEGPSAPRTFAARFDLDLVGDEVLGVAPAHQPPAPQQVNGTTASIPTRGALYDLLTSSPSIVRLYRRFVKPTRDRLRAARHARLVRRNGRSPGGETDGRYPCLDHFASTIGLPPAALAKAYEIEKVFHERILREADFATRQRLYREVYETVHAIYGSVPSDEVFASEPNPKEHTLWLFGSELANRSVLDVGCGRGELLVGIARRLPHGRLVGLDVAVPPSNGKLGIEFRAADIVAFDAAEGFEVVFSDNVIEHIAPADLDAHLQSVRRALRPGGTFIVLTPNRLFGPWDVTRIVDDNYANAVPAQGTHLNEMTYRELLPALARNGFGRFRTVLPLAKVQRRFRSVRLPAQVMSLAEATPPLVARVQAMPTKWRHLPAFEITVICRRQ